MNESLRDKKRNIMLEEIRAAAWKQIGAEGAASLSLRAVAREMGIAPTALYYYYKDRDALVTALLIDAFTSFGDVLEAARDACAPNDHAGRFRALCQAYFGWAVQNPQKYALLFDTPVPGHLFVNELGAVAQRSFLILQGVIGQAHAAGKVSGKWMSPRLPAALTARYEMLRKMGIPFTPGITHLALSVWSSMHGMASLYLHHYLAGFLGEAVEEFVEQETERMVRMVGL